MNRTKRTTILLVTAALAIATAPFAKCQVPETPPAAETPPATETPTFLSGPAAKVIDFLSTGSNWMAATYGIYDAGKKEAGGGLALLYRISDYAGAGLRLDYVGGKLWMPSGNFQLQAPMTLAGKVEVIPFAFTGLATPIAGKGSDNGSAVGLFGAGMAVKITKHVDLVADVEKWTGFTGEQYRFGILYKF